LFLQASDSPDLSPCGSYLFPKLKSGDQGYYFQPFDGVQKAVTDAIKTSDPAMRHGEFAGSSVLHQRDYFEGDNIE
jgi:hypothetical protein